MEYLKLGNEEDSAAGDFKERTFVLIGKIQRVYARIIRYA